jgi:AraC-like DNA-binding protein
MMLHPRTLQRRLKAQGMRFEVLVEDMRRNRAEEYLGCGSIPLAQVALLVGYSGQNAFTLACKRWFGMTPKRFRDQHLQRAHRSHSVAPARRLTKRP